jgi:hypothetical protein
MLKAVDMTEKYAESLDMTLKAVDMTEKHAESC